MKKKGTFILLAVFFILPLQAQKIPELKGYVNDYAGILSPSEENEISNLLSGLERSGTAQAAVLTVDNLQGYSIEDFSIKTADKWGLGSKERDNGLLILLAMEEKKVRIETGYGLEGTMTDAKSGYIIRNVIIPRFRNGDFAGGLKEGVQTVVSVLGGTSDITEEDLRNSDSDSRRSSSGGISFNVIIFIVIFLLSSVFRGRRRGGGLLNALFWGSVISNSSRRRGGGIGGGGFSGGGGFGGGGGFSGGGGGFGGGGASGGW